MAIATALPDGNGVDFYRQVRQRPGLSLTRAVLLADSKMSKYRAVVDSSADECVSVPLAPQEIAFVIGPVLARPP